MPSSRSIPEAMEVRCREGEVLSRRSVKQEGWSRGPSGTRRLLGGWQALK